MTNLERIQSMGIEEMATFLDGRLSYCEWCNPDAPVKPGTDECELFDCRLCVLDWLGKEDKDDIGENK